MNIADTIDTMVAMYNNAASFNTTILLEGAPGLGKTSAVYQFAERVGIPEDRVVCKRPSLMDPLELVGIPTADKKTHTTDFNPMSWLHRLQKGKWILVLDELPQAVPMLQNALSGLILDRKLDDIVLSPEVYIITTGNAVEHKAGANRLLTQLADRLCILKIDLSIDAWTNWAATREVDPLLVAFINWRDSQHDPVLLDFDPNRKVNATPRSWEMASRVPPTLPDCLYTEVLSGHIPTNRAVEYVAFRRMAEELPTAAEIVASPDKTPIPSAPDAKYALTGTLAQHCGSTKEFEAMFEYVARLPLDFQVLFVKLLDTRQLDPKDKSKGTGFRLFNTSKAYQQWVMKNAHVFKS